MSFVEEAQRNSAPSKLPSAVGYEDDSNEVVFEGAADEDPSSMPLDEAVFVDGGDMTEWREGGLDERTRVVPRRSDVDSGGASELKRFVRSLMVVFSAPEVEAPLLRGAILGWR